MQTIPQAPPHQVPTSNILATKVVLGLGANLGDALTTLKTTLISLKQLPNVKNVSSSNFYQTEPIDASGDDYINAVASVAFQPAVTLSAFFHDCQALERQSGRLRPFPNAPRTLDIDILLAWNARDSIALQSPELTVPHARMHQRAFVLLPLLEIDPTAEIPGHGAIATLLPKLSAQGIRKL